MLEINIASWRGDGRHVRILACLPTLRAFARVLTGERQSADDLVRRAVMRGLDPGRPLSAAVDQRLFLLTILHDLYQGDRIAKGASTIVDPHTKTAAGGEAGLESSAFQRVFWALRDDDRKALILTGAAGLSLAEAAIVCGCSAGTIGLWATQGRAALQRGLSQMRPAAAGMDWRAPPQATSGIDAASLAVAPPWGSDGPQRGDG